MRRLGRPSEWGSASVSMHREEMSEAERIGGSNRRWAPFCASIDSFQTQQHRGARAKIDQSQGATLDIDGRRGSARPERVNVGRGGWSRKDNLAASRGRIVQRRQPAGKRRGIRTRLSPSGSLPLLQGQPLKCLIKLNESKRAHLRACSLCEGKEGW